MDLTVHKEHFVDAGETDEAGGRAYTGYTFEAEGRQILVRRYDDDMGVACFMSHRGRSAESGEWRPLQYYRKIPYLDMLFLKAAAYLVKEEGVERLQILLPGGFEPVERGLT